MKKTAEYKLIPMSEITPEARDIAVAWVENYESSGMDLPAKHKLASDIMNYAKKYAEQLNQDKWVSVEEKANKLLDCITAVHPILNMGDKNENDLYLAYHELKSALPSPPKPK